MLRSDIGIFTVVVITIVQVITLFFDIPKLNFINSTALILNVIGICVMIKYFFFGKNIIIISNLLGVFSLISYLPVSLNIKISIGEFATINLEIVSLFFFFLLMLFLIPTKTKIEGYFEFSKPSINEETVSKFLVKFQDEDTDKLSEIIRENKLTNEARKAIKTIIKNRNSL